MAFERPDAKSTLILIQSGSQSNPTYRLSGTVRQTDSSGTTMIRITNQVLTSQVFDDLEIITPPSSNIDGDTNLTHFGVDWSDETPQ